MLRCTCLFLAALSGCSQMVTRSTVVDWESEGQLYAIGFDGKPAWKHDVKGICKDESAEYQISATAHGKNDDVIYVAIDCCNSMTNNNSAILLALGSDGQVQWQSLVICAGKDSQRCFSTMLVADSGAIYFVTQGSSNYQHQSTPGKMVVLSSKGVTLWSAPISSDMFIPCLGKGSSEGIVFVSGSNGRSLNALSATDGTVKWSVPLPNGEKTVQVDVTADGTVLALNRMGLQQPQGPSQMGGGYLTARSKDGSSLWTHTLWNKSGSEGWVEKLSMSEGSDGTSYINLEPTNSASRLLAISISGQQKWSLIGKKGPPSTQNSEGSIFATSYNSTQSLISLVMVKSDGSFSQFAGWRQGDSRRINEFPSRPLLTRDGSVYISDPNPEEEQDENGVLRAFNDKGREMLKVNCTLDFQPVAALDDTIYIKRCHYYQFGCSIYSLLAIDAKASAPKWEYVFNTTAWAGAVLV